MEREQADQGAERAGQATALDPQSGRGIRPAKPAKAGEGRRRLSSVLGAGRLRAAGLAPNLCSGSDDRALRANGGDIVCSRRRGAKPRFGAVHQHGSIAIIERFFRTLKTEMLRKLGLVPLRMPEMRREIRLYLGWYHRHRPHQDWAG